MKKAIMLLLVSMMAIPTLDAIAHSGDTNAQECHIDHRTGIRHCH